MNEQRAPTRRERQAAQTRSEILNAARDLFAKQGYAKTSVAQIAEAAGVSVQTIYDSVGSKAAIVGGLNDQFDETGGVSEIAPRLFASQDPREIIRLGTLISRTICERNGPISRLISTSAPAEPELAAFYQEGLRRHREGVKACAAKLAGLKALRKGLSKAQAADVFAALTEPQAIFVFIDGYGWTFDQWHRWIQGVLARELLGEA